MAEAAIELALKEREQLAKWMLKTAIMIDAASMGNRRSIDPQTIADLYRGVVSPGVCVDIGHVTSEVLASMIMREHLLFEGSGPAKPMRHKSGLSFRASLQLNHLALMVWRFPDVKMIKYASFEPMRFPLCCYPISQDPYKVPFTGFSTLAEFEMSMLVQVRP
jgi:hypothetical protein